MAAPSYTYANGPFNEDHSPAPGSSPPPPYHIFVANRSHRGSTSHPQGQSSPILTAFQALTRESPTHGHAASMSPTSAYAVLASEIAGAQGQVYHHLVQVPYPGIGYPPGSPPVPRQQPTSADTTTSTPAAIISASIPTATIITKPLWTEAQDRLLIRLRKDKLNSYLEISAALEEVYQVKRGEGAVKKRLVHLKARSKIWSEDKLNQAAQKAMQSFNSVMQEQLARSLNSSGNGQSVAMRLAVRLELEKMLAEDNGILTRTMQERIVSEQMERNAKHRTAMEQKEHGPEREWERGDGDEDGDQVSQGEDFEVL